MKVSITDSAVAEENERPWHVNGRAVLLQWCYHMTRGGISLLNYSVVVRSQNKSADVFASWDNACECACPLLSVPDDDMALAKPHARRIWAIL